MGSVARTVVVVAMAMGLAASAFAQPGTGIGTRVSGVVGGSFGTGGSTFATGGSAGFQFTRIAGFEFEMSVVPDLEFTAGDCNSTFTRCATPLPASLPVTVVYPFSISERGRAVNFVANYVAEFPTAVRWLRPYVLGGGGVSSVTRRLETMMVVPDPVFATLPTVIVVPRTLSATSTETDLALSTGGGVDFLVGRHFAVGADVRYMHVFARTGLDLTRVGSRFSVRF
jgi:hypothetical protein